MISIPITISVVLFVMWLHEADKNRLLRKELERKNQTVRKQRKAASLGVFN